MAIGSDNSIRVLGKCIGIVDGNTENGTPVNIYGCGVTDSQKWLLTSSGQIINVKAFKCLHATTNLNQSSIQIQDCDNSDNQRWNF